MINAGHDVIVVDDLSNAKIEVIDRIKEITGKRPYFYRTDCSDKSKMRDIFQNYCVDAVIHFAGYKAVGESVKKPLQYYRNNLDSTMTLLEVMEEFGCRKLVFSSSATVYGPNNPHPYKEDMEYLGKFYVSDGLKRVSVIKFLGCPVIRSQVIRIMPIKTDCKEVDMYYDFLFQYRLTRMYQLQFTQSGYFEKLQQALGKTPTGKWDDSDRAVFLYHWPKIENAFHKSYADYLNITAADALVVLLEKYSYAQITHMDQWVLARIFQASWKELYALSSPDFSLKKNNAISEKLQTA